jgi:hypothetical protein
MGAKPQMRCPPPYIDTMNACRTVMVAALKICGMPSHMYEMNAALTRALAAEDSETLWQQGEDIFAGLDTMPMDAALDANIARFAENVAATL